MARKYDVGSLLGPDFALDLDPETLAYEMSIDFSNQVIRRCAEIGMSLSELASRIGVRPSTLSEKLNGQNLTLKSIATMALALGCDAAAPELIADPGVGCRLGAGSSSLSGTVRVSDAAPPEGADWADIGFAANADAKVGADERAARSYVSGERIWKAA